MLTNLFVSIPCLRLLTMGFLLGPSPWLWKPMDEALLLWLCTLAPCLLRLVAVFPAPSSRLPIPFCSNLRQDPARGRRRWRTAAALLRYCVCPLQSPSAVSAAGQCWLYLVLVTILSLATILQRQHHIYCHNYTPTTFITAAAPDTHYLSYWTGRGHNIHISIISTTCLLYLSLLGCWIYIAWYLPCFI